MIADLSVQIYTSIVRLLLDYVQKRAFTSSKYANVVKIFLLGRYANWIIAWGSVQIGCMLGSYELRSWIVV